MESFNCCLAADIGGTNIRVALISEDLKIIKKLKASSSQDPLAILTQMINSLLLDSSGNANIVGTGLAVAAIIDKSSGASQSSNDCIDETSRFESAGYLRTFKRRMGFNGNASSGLKSLYVFII